MKALIASAGIALSILAIGYASKESSTPAPAPAVSSNSLAIRDVRIFDGKKTTPRGTVIVRNGKITAVGTDLEIPSDLTVMDGRGKTLLPGLIDSHTHVFGDALQEALRFGVTTELDMFTDVASLATMKKEQAAGPVTGRADLMSAGTLVTVAGGHGTEYFPIPTFTPGSDPQAFIDARIAEGSDYIKLVYEDGAAYGLSYPTLTKGDLAALILAAHKRGKKAVAHIGSVEGAKIAIDAGIDGLAHISADAVPDEDFGRLAARHHVFVVPTLTVCESASGVATGASLIEDKALSPYLSIVDRKALRGSFPHNARSKENLDHAIAAVRLLKAAGVPLLAGTDAPNPGTAHGVSLHRELELLVQAGLTPLEALTAATAIPSEIFSLADRGRILPGRRADLLLVDGDPTTDILQTRAISGVWRNGVRLDRRPTADVSARSAELTPELKSRIEAGKVTNFEQGTMRPLFGSGWTVTTDSMRGGKSKATMTLVPETTGGKARVLEIRGEIVSGFAFPWAGAMLFVGSKPMLPLDLSAKKELVFRARGNGPFRLMAFAETIGNIPASTSLTASDGWQEFIVPFKDMGGIDGRDLEALVFGGDQGSFWLQIDDVRFR